MTRSSIRWKRLVGGGIGEVSCLTSCRSGCNPSRSRAAPQRGSRMTKADWLSLVTTEDVYGEFSLVGQPRKLLLFGVLLMRRVWPLLDEGVRRIVEIAEQCAAGTINPRELRFGGSELARDPAWFAARASRRL